MLRSTRRTIQMAQGTSTRPNHRTVQCHDSAIRRRTRFSLFRLLVSIGRRTMRNAREMEQRRSASQLDLLHRSLRAHGAQHGQSSIAHLKDLRLPASATVSRFSVWQPSCHIHRNSYIVARITKHRFIKSSQIYQPRGAGTFLPLCLYPVHIISFLLLRHLIFPSSPILTPPYPIIFSLIFKLIFHNPSSKRHSSKHKHDTNNTFNTQSSIFTA